jgi:hypothetical protein
MCFRSLSLPVRLRAVLLLGGVAAAASCGGDGNGPSGPPEPPAVAEVELDPTTLDLVIGQASRVTATVRAADGSTLTDRTVTWATGDAGIATVEAGEVTAVAPGEVEITATSEGRTGTATVTVLGHGTGLTRTWQGVSGDWFEPGNWDPAGTPTPLDTVRVPAGPANQPVLESGATVARLHIVGGRLRIAGVTLHVVEPRSTEPTVKVAQQRAHSGAPAGSQP